MQRVQTFVVLRVLRVQRVQKNAVVDGAVVDKTGL